MQDSCYFTHESLHNGNSEKEKKVRPHLQNTPETIDLFRSQLDQIINMEHELFQLAHAVDWDYLNEKNSGFYDEEGQPGVTSRLMIGLHILKQSIR